MGAECLILSRGRNLLVDSQIRQECFNFRPPYVFGVALVRKRDVSSDPVDVGFLCAVGVVIQPHGLAYLTQQFCRLLLNGGSPVLSVDFVINAT